MIESIERNPLGHAAFADMVRSLVDPTSCRHCGTHHSRGLCQRAQHEAQQERAWADREIE